MKLLYNHLKVFKNSVAYTSQMLMKYDLTYKPQILKICGNTTKLT